MHCKSKKQAQGIKDVIEKRLGRCKLELHPEKTRIVYCKDANRRGNHEYERFDFLGFTFQQRKARSRRECWMSFLPAVSSKAKKRIGQEIRKWRIHRRTAATIEQIAERINPQVRGWINYYGHFYKSEMYPLLYIIECYIIRWARAKYRKLRTSIRRATKWIECVVKAKPNLFVHRQVLYHTRIR